VVVALAFFCVPLERVLCRFQAFLNLLAVLCRYGGAAARRCFATYPELNAVEVLFQLITRRLPISLKEAAFGVLAQLASTHNKVCGAHGCFPRLMADLC
jgi:hypothetical protein